MKIIELLNKIANDEEVPKKIKYDGQIYTYSNCRYKTQDGYSDLLGTKNMFYSGVLNYEVEIIEDKPKKIGKMTVLGKDITLGSMENWIDNELNDNEQKICSAIDIIGIKTNEIIIALNYLLEKSDKE